MKSHYFMTLQPARQISIECSIYWEAHAMLRFLSALLTLPLIVILGFLWFGLAQPLARVLSIRLPPGPADPAATSQGRRMSAPMVNDRKTPV